MRPAGPGPAGRIEKYFPESSSNWIENFFSYPSIHGQGPAGRIEKCFHESSSNWFGNVQLKKVSKPIRTRFGELFLNATCRAPTMYSIEGYEKKFSNQFELDSGRHFSTRPAGP